MLFDRQREDQLAIYSVDFGGSVNITCLSETEHDWDTTAAQFRHVARVQLTFSYLKSAVCLHFSKNASCSFIYIFSKRDMFVYIFEKISCLFIIWSPLGKLHMDHMAHTSI